MRERDVLCYVLTLGSMVRMKRLKHHTDLNLFRSKKRKKKNAKKKSD